ncbi:protein FAM188B isoform X2 [Arapaima gigas]
MSAAVEEVAAALVREFLSRKGLQKTRVCIDEELPRTDSSISNRKALRQVLHLESLYKKNKLQEFPLKTMLEMIVKRHMEENGDVNDCSAQQDFSKEADVPKNSDTLVPHLKNTTRPGSPPVTQGYIKVKRLETNFPFLSCRSVGGNSVLPSKNVFLCHTWETNNQNVTMSPRCSSGDEMGSQQVSVGLEKEHSGCRVAERSCTEAQRNRFSGRMVRGMMAGPVSSATQESSKRRPTRRLCSVSGARLKGVENAPDFTAHSPQSHSHEEVTHTAKSPVTRDRHTVRTAVGASTLLAGMMGTSDSGTCEQLKAVDKNGERGERSQKKKHQTLNAQISANNPAAGDRHSGCLILDDISDDEKLCELSSRPTISRSPSKNFSACPVSQKMATTLKEVLFGSPLSCFSNEWKAQSFTFSDIRELRYGIIQKKGGPCGVLASVQARVLQKLLFEDASSASDHERLQPSEALRSRCLLLALAEILWRAGGNKRAAVAVSSGKKHFIPVGRYKTEGVLETITICNVENMEDLKALLDQHIKQFESGPFGCILFTISAILSRSVERVRADFDVPTNSLIGAHGYCTQEVVNLLLVGQALSNVFNDDFELSSGDGSKTVLKGIKERGDVGFLSLFEHYDICKVGTYLKNPRFPIWVVCSESHFSVLFSTSKELTKDCVVPKKFDLCYYDGLANQLEEIRLTITTGAAPAASAEVDLTPPLELCIRTKWKDAQVNWNQTEPIL